MKLRPTPSTIAVYLLFYCLLSGTHIFAQKNINLINYHINNSNRRDLNQIYINSKTAKIKNLDTSSFVDGAISRNSDTIKCKIYLPKNKINDDSYLYIIAKLSDDSNYIFTPKDINGFAAGNITMQAHRSVASGDTNYFFIKLIVKGTVTLYARGVIPSDKEFVYYFKKPLDNDLLFFAPDRKSDFYTQERYDKDSPMLSKYSSPNEELFRAAFSEYLKDCEGIYNKILAKIYTISDIETIIKEYNSCNK